MSPQGSRQARCCKMGGSRQIVEYASDISLSHPIWLPCPGEIFSEQRPIFFPITATVLVEWPICLSRRTGHARLAGMTGEDGDKEGGVCIDSDAPPLVTWTVQFNSLIDAWNQSLAHCRSKNSWWESKLTNRHACPEVYYVLLFYFLFVCISECTRPTSEFPF